MAKALGKTDDYDYFAVLTMGPEANKNWGSNAEDAPPQG